MPRNARCVEPGLAYHVTQRGVNRQRVFFTIADYKLYLELLRSQLAVTHVEVLAYCLMSNHVHLVVVPRRAEGLAEAFHQVHGRYASYWNSSHASSGHVWQGRFYSCPMDPGHLWTALRYVELNPVRAGMAVEAAGWPWSSAGAHCGRVDPDAWLEMSAWRQNWTAEAWRKFLAQGETAAEVRALRRSTRTGRPWGPREFTRRLEAVVQRSLTPGPRGRPRKTPEIHPAGTLNP